MKTVMFPGQGSQYKGMGKDLFKNFKNETLNASNMLGYDLEELCVNDPNRQLGKTQFTQPALYFVNALHHLEMGEVNPDFYIGHSLGEYNALLAAGAFDLETGLKLVQKRGALMAAASGGGMAAVLKIPAEELRQRLDDGGYEGIDIANYNTPEQIVIAGQKEELNKVVKDFGEKDIRIIPLFVSAPFHSRYMKPAAEEFADFVNQFDFSPLKTPVIANFTALPYETGSIEQMLCSQITGSVQWTDTIRVLMGEGVTVFQEVGASILTKMVKKIKENCSPIVRATSTPAPKPEPKQQSKPSGVKINIAQTLGCDEFRKDYCVDYAYLAGAMYRGIASKELVVRMAKARMLSFLGTGGLSLEAIEENIDAIQGELENGETFGLNLLHNFIEPEFEMKTVELYLRKGIKNIEAAAFMQVTKPIVYFFLKGLSKDSNGNTVISHRIMAKISRPEVAEAFIRPAPSKIVNNLLNEGLITEEQAELSKSIPLSYDICVEADSGGHTDSGVAMVLLPVMQRLRDDIGREMGYDKAVRVGLAGGIGTPQSAASAFIMGADFILTGSINQCTVEAGISETVKDLLQEINVQDTAYAPAGDMFEIGAKVQVLKKGVLFPARANKLFLLYNRYGSLEEIPAKTIKQLEKNYFKKPINQVWEETRAYFLEKGNTEVIEKAEKKAKAKMALIFRWYFGYSSRISFKGDFNEKADFQVHTGPSLGAFNQWVKGTNLENWRNRHSDEIGIKIMNETAELLINSLTAVSV